jgi:hypothetical protein
VSISAFGSLKNSFRWLVSSPFVAVGLTLTRLPQADAWTRNSEVPVPVKYTMAKQAPHLLDNSK